LYSKHTFEYHKSRDDFFLIVGYCSFSIQLEINSALGIEDFIYGKDHYRLLLHNGDSFEYSNVDIFIILITFYCILWRYVPEFTKKWPHFVWNELDLFLGKVAGWSHWELKSNFLFMKMRSMARWLINL